MSIEQVGMLVILVIVISIMVRVYQWLRDGGAYYRRYPAAKLMDDMGKSGTLRAKQMDEIIQRVGSTDDQYAEVAELRQEMRVK